MARESHRLYFVGFNPEDALYSTPFADYEDALEYRKQQYVDPGVDEELHVYKAVVELSHFDLKNAEVR